MVLIFGIFPLPKCTNRSVEQYLPNILNGYSNYNLRAFSLHDGKYMKWKEDWFIWFALLFYLNKSSTMHYNAMEYFFKSSMELKY